MKIRVAIVGYGNIGKYALEAVQQETDMELAGLVVRTANTSLAQRLKVPVVVDIGELGPVDVALLCIPTRAVREEAMKYLARGIRTVDSFDIHGEEMWDLKTYLDRVCRDNAAAAIISAGWDPGSDSLVRAIMSVVAPRGVTYTNFGPGMSMGHSVVAKSLAGVEDAVSLTIPQGTGLHRRLVYVKLKPGADAGEIEARIKTDSYFRGNETFVYVVDDVEPYKDMGHGVAIERKGRSGATHNQLLSYRHRINNPAGTSQVMVAAARAVTRQQPGCYTMLEVPLADYLNMSRHELVTKMI